MSQQDEQPAPSSGEAARLAVRVRERLMVAATALDLEYPDRKRAIVEAKQVMEEAAALLQQQADIIAGLRADTQHYWDEWHKGIDREVRAEAELARLRKEPR